MDNQNAEEEVQPPPPFQHTPGDDSTEPPPPPLVVDDLHRLAPPSIMSSASSSSALASSSSSIIHQPLPGDMSDTESLPPPYGQEPLLRRSTVMLSSRYRQADPISISHRVIAPGTFSYRDHPDERILPPEWLQFIHPEGKVYFYHPRLRIVTESWIYHPPTFHRLLTWANIFFQIVARQGVILPVTSEICLELDEETDDCSYYLVDHARRTEFWVEPTTTDLLELPAVSSQTHLKLTLEHHYWTHVEYFPVHLHLSEDVESELHGILLHSCADSMTSDLSTSPISSEKCQAYLQLLQSLHNSPVSRGYNNCIIARLWGEFARNRFINLHGENSARLCRDQMLADDPEKEQSPILTFANYLLFDVPAGHLDSLKKLFVDDIAYTEHWQRFVKQIIGEWQEASLASLLLLIIELILFTNLSRSENTTRTKDVWISVQYASSLIAILLAASSSLIGLSLIRHHKRLSDTHAAEATNFLFSHQHQTLGLRPLATLYAVPFGFLTWSMISLVIALLLLSLDLQNLITRIVVWVFCFGLVGMTVLIFGLMGQFRGLRNLKRGWTGVWIGRGKWRRVRGALFGWMRVPRWRLRVGLPSGVLFWRRTTDTSSSIDDLEAGVSAPVIGAAPPPHEVAAPSSSTSTSGILDSNV